MSGRKPRKATPHERIDNAARYMKAIEARIVEVEQKLRVYQLAFENVEEMMRKSDEIIRHQDERIHQLERKLQKAKVTRIVE